MSLSGLSAWQQLLDADDVDEQNKLIISLVPLLDEKAVKEVVEFCRTGEIKEREKAIRLLYSMRREKSLVFNEAAQRAAVPFLLDFLKNTYPEDPDSFAAIGLLILIDKDAASAFLLQEINLADVPARNVRTVLQHLAEGNVAAQQRLREVAEFAGQIGKIANSILESRGLISAEKLKSLGQEFRATKKAVLLHRIYGSYIWKQVNQPIAPVLELLGEPTEIYGGDTYIYRAEESQLTLEVDNNGLIIGDKIV